MPIFSRVDNLIIKTNQRYMEGTSHTSKWCVVQLDEGRCPVGRAFPSHKRLLNVRADLKDTDIQNFVVSIRVQWERNGIARRIF